MSKKTSSQYCYLNLPFIGKVIKNEKARGFLLIGSDSFTGAVFAHYKGNISGADSSILKIGTVCFFLAENGDKGVRAPSWIASRDVTWTGAPPQSKKAYDEEREAFLRQVPFDQLEKLINQESELAPQNSTSMAAAFQQAMHKSREIFLREEDDPVLYQVVPKRIEAILQGLKITDPKFADISMDYKALPQWEPECLFDRYERLIAAKLRTLDTASPFYEERTALFKLSKDIDCLSLEIIPAIDWLNSPDISDTEGMKAAKAVFSAKQLLKLIWRESISKETSDWLLSQITQENLFNDVALVFDLETSKTSIREVGYCIGSEEKEGDVKLLPDLENAVSTAKVLVGHNVLNWDLPILREHQGMIPDEKPVWDTLLISFLLEPWKTSHALGGAHTALSDAKMCKALFTQQVATIGADKVLDAIRESYGQGNASFYRALCSRLPMFDAKPLPEWARNAGKLNTLPDCWIKELHWCPNVLAGDSAFIWKVTPEWLDDRAGSENDPWVIVLLNILGRALRANISIHKELLPLWMKDADNRPSIKALLDILDKYLEPADKNIRRFIPLSNINEEKAEQIECIFSSGLSSNHLVLPPVWSANAPETSNKDTWVEKDQFCSKIGGRKPWKLLRRLPIEGKQIVNLPFAGAQFRYALWNLPLLFPNSTAVQQYWIETIFRFLGVAKKVQGKVVPILFVDADGRFIKSGEKDFGLAEILQCALMALGKSFDPQSYHSRARRLQIAKSDGTFLVEPISSMHAWIALSDELGIEIHPVLESLPLESWSLLELPNAEKGEEDLPEDNGESDSFGSEEDSDEGGEAKDIDDHPVPVSQEEQVNTLAAQLIQNANKLSQQYLKGWLLDMAGPLVDRFMFTVIDPRAQGISRKETESFVFSYQEEELNKLRGALGEIAPVERKQPSTDIEELKGFVKKNFYADRPFKNFYDYQEEPVNKTLNRDAGLTMLVRLPTGAGKSLIFQAPNLFRALSTQCLTLVISPLKALMQDQVSSLHEKGFGTEVEYLSSDRPWWETNQVLQGVLDNSITMLYVAPERMRSKSFISVLGRRMEQDKEYGGLEHLVFDEAHCISQWGHEFRPDYLYAAKKIAELRKKYAFPVSLFSATVPDATKTAITKALSLDVDDLTLEPEELGEPIKGAIHINPQPVNGTVLDYEEQDWELDERIEKIAQVIKQSQKESAVIVFVQRRAHAESVANLLTEQIGEAEQSDKTTVEYFHAGLSAHERQEVYERYKDGKLKALVATKAFGMGMDIGHIHHCIHLSPSSYIEDYLQEVGRIGRDDQKDELPADLIYSDRDNGSAFVMHLHSRMQPENIKDFWNAIRKMSRPVGERSIAWLPSFGCPELPDDPFQKGSLSSKSTKIRNAIHWIEKAGRVEVLQMMPSTLEINVDTQVLEQYTKSSEAGKNARKVAEAIASLAGLKSAEYSPNPHGNSRSDESANATSIVDSVIEAFGSFIGFVFGTPKESDTSEKPDANKSTQEAVHTHRTHCMLELDALGKKTGLGPDELLSAIWELVKASKLTIESKVTCSAGWIAKEEAKAKKRSESELIEWVEKHYSDALNKIAKNDGNLLDWESMGVTFLQSQDDKKQPRFERNQERTLRKLLRLAGGRVERVVSADHSVRDRIRFSGFTNKKRRCKTIVSLAKKIWRRLGKTILSSYQDRDGVTISLSELLECCDGQPRIREIEQALDLLSCMGLIHPKEKLLPMSYLLEIKEPGQPLDLAEISKDLAEINAMSEMRMRAMQAFCYMNPGRVKAEFLPAYFRCGDSKELREFLMNSLNEEAKQQDVRPDIAVKLTRLREHIDPNFIHEQFEKVFAKHRACNEQWSAISQEIDQHILINAGPGAGKTSVLIAHIIHLIREQNLDPREIMVLAFNRAVVHEIRHRVKKVFEAVGYGGYVRSLRVSTFHSLAARHVDRGENVERNKLLECFAEQLDVSTAENIAGGVRTILVDEFQDMNDARWEILTRLQKANDASIFAIGDDDQDIVAWDRPNHEGCKGYFQNFKEEIHPEVLSLTTNFRSASEVVGRSKEMISKLVPNREKQKSDLKPFSKDVGKVIRETNCAEANILGILQKELSQAEKAKESIAILCRTNAEVAKWHEKLEEVFQELKVQGSGKYPLAWLRHVAVWLDILNKEEHQSKQLIDKGFRREIFKQWLDEDIPEAREAKKLQDGSEFKQQLCNLWNWCREDNPHARVRDLIEFVNDLQTDDYDRMKEQRCQKDKEFHAVISTIHKVKGLEFDRVVVLPSRVPFPFPDPSKGDPRKEAEAEAKTYYVAMTRAKQRLVYFIGEREKAWGNQTKKTYDGKASGGGTIFGRPKELVISWAGYRDSGKGKVRQNEIMRNILVGERLTIREGELIWPNKGDQIGLLAKRQVNMTECGVSAVLRYPQSEDSDFFKNGGGDFNKLTDEVKKQGWLWLVCVQGYCTAVSSSNPEAASKRNRSSSAQ